MKKSHALASAALILWGVICPVAAQTWISTWAAPAFARVDQPAQTLSSTARAFPWSQYVPTAAAGQELVVAGASLLHFKDQTIRQIAHVSAGGSQVRVVLANSLGTLPLRIGAASVAMRDSGSRYWRDQTGRSHLVGCPHPRSPQARSLSAILSTSRWEVFLMS